MQFLVVCAFSRMVYDKSMLSQYISKSSKVSMSEIASFNNR